MGMNADSYGQHAGRHMGRGIEKRNTGDDHAHKPGGEMETDKAAGDRHWYAAVNQWKKEQQPGNRAFPESNAKRRGASRCGDPRERE
jgi:hypothetical protein